MKAATVVLGTLLLMACGGASPPTTAASPPSARPTTQPTIQLSVASKWTITDTEKVTVAGTATPGVTLEVTSPGATSKGKVDGQGIFSIDFGGLPEGDTKITIVATEFGYIQAQQSVIVTRLLSPATYKASAASIPYNQLIKDPGSLAGRVVTYTGQVFQYDSNTTTSHLIVSVTDGGYGFWSDNIWCDLDPATGQKCSTRR